MAGPSKNPKPPSAFDGYRRLERTRNVMTDRPVAVATARMPRTRKLRARLAGSMRLAAFVTVLAIIIGTSVGLASADTRASSNPPSRSAAVSVEPAAREKPANTADDVTTTRVADAVSEDTAVAAAAAAPVAAQVRRGTALPFTGEPSVDRILLAGSTLVLFGMLVQIAGQPLPARTRARARR